MRSKRYSMSWSQEEMLTLEMALHDAAKRTRSQRAERMAKRVTEQLKRRENCAQESEAAE